MKAIKERRFYWVSASDDRDRLCRIDYGLPQPRQKADCNVLHDSLGDVIAEPTPGGSRQFSYFASGRVRGISSGGAQATFGYGPFGDLQALDVLGTTAQAWHERRYGLIDWRSIASAGGSQPLLSRFVPGPGGIVASRRGPGNDWIFQLGEQRGNRFFTNLSGAFVQTIDYQPFGVADSQGVGPASEDYSSNQWNGGDALAEFGLVQLGARTYDPRIGRFLSRDPLVMARTSSTSNPYAFAANDPINRADPTGLDPCDNPTDCTSTPDLPAEPGGGGSSGSKSGQTGSPSSVPPAPTVSTGPVTLAPSASTGPVTLDSSARDDALTSIYRRSMTMVQEAVAKEAGLLLAAGFVPSQRTVFAGHGAWLPQAGMIRVPKGTWITFYSKFGTALGVKLGFDILTGQIPGDVFHETYGPGKFIPNYLLAPPDAGEVILPDVMMPHYVWSTHMTGLLPQGLFVTVSERRYLSELLKPNMGAVCWSACTSFQLPLLPLDILYGE